MIKSIIVLVKIFLLLLLFMGLMVSAFFFFFEGLNYLSEGVFSFDKLWRGLKGALFGAVPASFIFWIFYYLVPSLKK